MDYRYLVITRLVGHDSVGAGSNTSKKRTGPIEVFLIGLQAEKVLGTARVMSGETARKNIAELLRQTGATFVPELIR